MKNLLRFLFGSLAVGLMAFLGYSLIIYGRSLVAAGEYAGLIKLGVTIGIILVCGSVFLISTIFVATLATFVGEIVSLFFSSIYEFFMDQFSPTRRIFVGMKFKDTTYRGASECTIVQIEKGKRSLITYTSNETFSMLGDGRHTMALSYLRNMLKSGKIVRIK